METHIEVGDEVRLYVSGLVTKVIAIDRFSGVFILDGGLQRHRYEFVPTKWDEDKVGNTGIGVCAKNGSEG